jgi:hypothetical protein
MRLPLFRTIPLNAAKAESKPQQQTKALTEGLEKVSA